MASSNLRRVALAALAVLTAAACSVNKTEPPTSSGPSELGTSLQLSANPDTITQDGNSTAQIVVQARDANGSPLGGLPLRVEIFVNGALQDFGRLSARNITTAGDGRATVMYTAPQAIDGVDRLTTVSIAATPVGSDFRAAIARSVDIRLVPPGVITPPGTQVPNFTVTPSGPTQLQTVTFDASDPNLDHLITRYDWTFGDGTTATGRVVSHQYRQAGTFTATLTVTDFAGARGSRSRSITVQAGLRPTASFVISPTAPGVGEQVLFNAAASTANPPRQIVDYTWQFGDGVRANGVAVFHKYNREGSYVASLTVTDDAGLTATATQTVVVGGTGTGGLVARFTFSPASPGVGQPVFFNATTSSSADPIVEYRWDYGDGTTGFGATPAGKTYGAANTYRVTLRITDAAGRSASVTQDVTIN